MSEIQSALLYVFTFLALYIQVFLLMAAFTKRNQITVETTPGEDTVWPGVTVIVPCWNEEGTVAQTVESLLALDYPREQLFIKMVDDGSTDGTWQKMQQFVGIPNIEIIHKENGGKHTAMNRAIETTTTEFVGCLDADTFVRPDALKKIIWNFIKDPEVMAVAPSVVVHNPKGFLQKAQQVEYDMGVFIKKVLGLMDGIHVTPGPFSFYRKHVFDTIGAYRKAHNAEDMEIAYRMQINHYKIVHCHDAYVYTVTPQTVKKLYKQRLRWIYGFINNTIDYKDYLFRPSYGVFSMFTVPTGFFALIGTMLMTIFLVVSLGEGMYHLINYIMVAGFSFTLPAISHINFFYLDLGPISLLSIILYTCFLITVLIGQKMREHKPIPTLSIIYFLIIYQILSPIWLAKAFYNTAFARDVKWR